MSHTPGPWNILPRGGRIKRDHIMGADHCRVTVLDDCHMPEEAAANAALIVAAPELLELVRYLSEDACVYGRSDGNDCGGPAVKESVCGPCEARALLARVEGKS